MKRVASTSAAGGRAIASWKLSTSDGGVAAADHRRDAANARENMSRILSGWGHGSVGAPSFVPPQNQRTGCRREDAIALGKHFFAALKMTPLQKGLLETATGRQRRGEPPLSLQPATRSPAVVPCAHSWRCPVAHCEPADRHDREHAARRKIGTPRLFAYSNSTDRRKRIFTNRFSRSHRISLNRFTFQLLVRNVSSPSGKLFGGRSAAFDFVDLVQSGFCIRLVAPLQGSLERHFATSPTARPDLFVCCPTV